MAIYNTPSDSANTAIRAFLTRVGEHYLGYGFNTSSGKGKALWEAIKLDFNNCCAYCGEEHPQLQVEHVIMFNRSEYGLHHPGNFIPCCKSCNKRGRHQDKTYFNWEEHLEDVCLRRNENEHLAKRLNRIENNFRKYNYPALTDEEQHAIRVIANSLYENIKTESEKSLALIKNWIRHLLVKLHKKPFNNALRAGTPASQQPREISMN